MGRRREFRQVQHLDSAALAHSRVSGGATRRRRLHRTLDSDAAPLVGQEGRARRVRSSRRRRARSAATSAQGNVAGKCNTIRRTSA